jgi:eukaryotic-like serine/threonine-protein kinase
MSERTLVHQTLGRYQLLVAVARGGMGQVWLGRLQGARGFNKLVAIKTLLPGGQDLARFESMLAEEARIASLIQHANVVHTMELGEHEGLLYLAMEWVDGEPLGFLLERAQERGGMPMAVAVALVSQVLAGLHAAHELSDESGPFGVVHRDVSPHNILVTYDGVAKLLDFGIAKATRQPSTNTETGEVKGKFSYMAPEQILSGDVDRRCDIFAAGIVLYLLTTGRHPFKHHNTAAVIHAITTDDAVQPPSTLLEDYPAELEQVLLKALEKDVEKRWPTAEEMRVALEQAVPEAFGDVGRTALRDFMQRVVGDRKIARREAVRRAQLAADGRDIETGSRAALQSSSSQSASSLRAISISQPAPEDVPEIVGAESGPRTLPAPPRKRAIRAPWIAASAGILLALAATVTRLVAPSTVGKSNAAAAVSAGVPLVASAPVQPPQPETQAPPQLSAGAPATEAPAVSAGLAPAASASAQPKPSPARAPSNGKRSSTKKATAKGASGTDDLLAPDYAR